MNAIKPKMRPLKISSGQKRDVRTQFGTLCYRVQNDKVQILLVTSRGTGRWIMPKGWPMHGATPIEAAAREAWEEAGVEGKIMGNAIGIYSYNKLEDKKDDLPCIVAIFPLKVQRLADDYPEVSMRRRKWFSVEKAAAKLDEPELRQIVRNFDPRLLAR
jgi:8-oxo-dGTP pyrophosphatase MutT (NUDIX family)